MGKKYIEVDSSLPAWTWCDVCEQMQPPIHDCQPGASPVSVHDQDTETVDWWSVEAYLRGYHGRQDQQRAQRAIQQGRCDPQKTKSTEMRGWW